MNPKAGPLHAEVVARVVSPAEATVYLENANYGAVEIVAGGLAAGRHTSPPLGDWALVALIRLPPDRSDRDGVCMGVWTVQIDDFWNGLRGHVVWSEPWAIAELRPHFPVTKWNTGMWQLARPETPLEKKVEDLHQRLLCVADYVEKLRVRETGDAAARVARDVAKIIRGGEPEPEPKRAERAAEPVPCPDCGGSGVIETGNNDLPCDCPAGDAAVFNVSGMGRVRGSELKRRR